MLKKSLFVVAAVTLLAVAAQAGEIKIHSWPTSYIPQEITQIPVLMDVGFWVGIKDQDKLKIKLQQVSIHEYSGCTDMKVSNNFELTVSSSISGNGAVPGKYSSSVSPADLGIGVDQVVSVCATLKEANLSGVNGGTKDVEVATVTIKVVPR